MCVALVVHPPIEETGYNLPTSIEERDIGRASRAFSRLGFFFFFSLKGRPMMIGNERLEDESERILDVNRANLVAEMDQGWKEYYRHLRSFFFR